MCLEFHLQRNTYARHRFSTQLPPSSPLSSRQTFNGRDHWIDVIDEKPYLLAEVVKARLHLLRRRLSSGEKEIESSSKRVLGAQKRERRASSSEELAPSVLMYLYVYDLLSSNVTLHSEE